MFNSDNFDIGNKICTVILLTFLITVFSSFSAWYFSFEYFRFTLILLFSIFFLLFLNFIYTLQFINEPRQQQRPFSHQR